MNQGKERLGSVQAILEHITCRCKWQTLPLWLFLPWHSRGAALRCVSTRSTQILGLCQFLCPGRQAQCLPGTLQACRESAGEPTGGIKVIATKSQTCGKTTPNPSTDDISPSRAHSVTGESMGVPKSPQCQSSVSCGAATPSCVSGLCWTPEHPSPEDPSSPQPVLVPPGHQSTPAPSIPAVPSLLHTTVSARRLRSRAVVLCWDRKGDEGTGRDGSGCRAGHGLVIALHGHQAAPSVRTMIGTDHQTAGMHHVCVCVCVCVQAKVISQDRARGFSGKLEHPLPIYTQKTRSPA